MKLAKAFLKQFLTITTILILSFLLSAIPLIIASESPVSAFIELFKGVVGTKVNIATMFIRNIPIIITGVATCIAFKSGIYNLGVEGQMMIGALTCAVVANVLREVHPAISVPVVILFGCASGGLVAFLCALLETEIKVPILISSLLVNYIINLFGSYLTIFPLRDRTGGSAVAQTMMIAEQFRLPVILPGTRLHIGVILIIILPILAHFLFKKTSLGYEMRMSGINPTFAESSGIHMKKNILLTMFISGCLGGLAGVVTVMGIDYRYIDGLIAKTGYAWTGFIAAQLTSSEPLPIIITGTFLSALGVGAAGLQRNAGIPAELANVIQAVIIFTFTMREKIFSNLGKIVKDK